MEAGEPSCEEMGVYVGDDKGEGIEETTSAFRWGGGKRQAHDETRVRRVRWWRMPAFWRLVRSTLPWYIPLRCHRRII